MLNVQWRTGQGMWGESSVSGKVKCVELAEPLVLYFQNPDCLHKGTVLSTHSISL